MPIDPEEELAAMKKLHAPTIVTVDPHRVLTDEQAKDLDARLAKAVSERRSGAEIWSIVKGAFEVAKIFM